MVMNLMWKRLYSTRANTTMWTTTIAPFAMVVVVVLLSLFSGAVDGRRRQPDSREYLLSLTNSARPSQGDADPAFDCAWREYAFEYAHELQTLSEVHSGQIFDALQLSGLCKKSLAELLAALPTTTTTTSRMRRHRHRFVLPEGACAVYVDPVHGVDTNPGTQAAPVRTMAVGLNITRKQKQKNTANTSTNTSNTAAAAGCALTLRAGTHYLENTLMLEPEDSHLTIAAFGNEPVVVSGGARLSGLTWKPVSPGSPIFVADTNRAKEGGKPTAIPALQVENSRATLARYPNANPEIDLFPAGYITATTAWSPPEYNGQVCNPHMQCGISANVTVEVTDVWHGMYQNYTVGYGGSCELYDPPYSPWCSGQFYLERQFPEMHTRHPSGVDISNLPRAQDYTPEVSKGAVVHAWRPGHWYTWMFEVDDVELGNRTTTWTRHDNENNVYGLAAARINSTDVLYLGQFKSADDCGRACNATGKCHTWTWHSPAFGDADWREGCYSRRDGAYAPTSERDVISAVGPQTNGKLKFGRGGNQGGEGNDGAGEWFIEGLMAELDAPNEYFYNASTGLLYLYWNGTAVSPGPPSEVIVPKLANFIEVRGTQAYPVVNVTIQGLNITQSRPTFLDPRGNPSGGDWALERMGAVLLEGTEDVTVRDSNFIRLDGNAVFLSGYNRNAQILDNEFSWLGQNAIASWGRSERYDGTGGEQPRGTRIAGNWVHEIGHIQKQSSFYFQAVTALTMIENNIVFNIPRAGINFNDGFGGGNEIKSNLLFNSCRESSDHGAFNSWDRLPYLTAIRDGETPSTAPADNNVHHNFIVANYAADGGCLDNDDGSSYYQIHHNFCVYGGHKSDFDGNRKVSSYNLAVYPSVYGVRCVAILQSLPPKGYAEGYVGNTCILPSAGSQYVDVAGINSHAKCLTDDARDVFNAGMILGNNTIYAPSADATVVCGGTTENASVFFANGYDRGSIVRGDMPSADTIVDWAKKLLQN